MVAADFNGDGKLDIATGGNGSTTGIDILLGNGDGTFQAPLLATNAEVGTMAAADLTGDGMLDLIDSYCTAGYGCTPPLVEWVLNGGNGIFYPGFITYTGGAVVAGDFNGDGRIDFIAGNQVFLQVPAISGLPSSALSFGNQQVGTSSSPQTAQVQNTGSGLLTFTSIQASANFTESDNCQPSVAAGASCTINVTFSPTTIGPLTGTLTLTDNASGSPQVVQLSGTGVLPAPNVSPAGLSFGNQLVGTVSASQPVTVTNTGPAALSFTSLAISSGWTQSNNCLPSVAANASCTINVSFSPTAGGLQSGALTLTDNAINSPQTVSLSGTGLAPVVSLSATSLNFAGQSVSTTSASQPVTLTNTGTGTLISLTITSSGDFAQTNNCAGSVAPTASCMINVTFTPTAIGSRTGTLTLTDSASDSPQMINLSGTGLGATASLSASSLTFPSQLVGTTSSSQQITLQNTGNTALSITSITLGGSNPGDFSLSQTCGNSVAAGSNCTLTVTFTPTARGARSATVSIVDNAADSPQTISLTGTGTAPTADISPSSLTFPGQFVGTTGLPQNITLTNNGNVALNISSIQASAQFGTSNGCTSSLAVGVSCTISVFFDPSSAGTQTGTLTVTDNAPASPQTVALSGTGEDFSVAAASGSSTSATVTAGQTATYPLAVNPAGGFNQSVTFTCSGAPSLSTCSVSPSPLTLSGTSAGTATVTVSTTARSGMRMRPKPPLGPWVWLSMLGLLAAVGARLLGGRRLAWRRAWVPLAVAVVGLTLWAACGGGGGGGGGGNPGTPTGTYTLTVTGTTSSGSSTLSHSVTLTLNVS